MKTSWLLVLCLAFGCAGDFDSSPTPDGGSGSDAIRATANGTNEGDDIGSKGADDSSDDAGDSDTGTDALGDGGDDKGSGDSGNADGSGDGTLDGDDDGAEPPPGTFNSRTFFAEQIMPVFTAECTTCHADPRFNPPVQGPLTIFNYKRMETLLRNGDSAIANELAEKLSGTAAHGGGDRCRND